MKFLVFCLLNFYFFNLLLKDHFLQKLMNISAHSELDLFVITRATFYENFKALRLNEQRAS